MPSRFARTPGQATAAAAEAAAERAKAGGQLPIAAEPKTLTSVLKRLTFSAAKPTLGGVEQSSSTPHHTLAKQPGRHVTFGADTVSPAARPAARRQSHVHFQTPQPAINEEEGAESPAPSEVNSVNAGRTPYDARLSGLLRKYNLGGTPEGPDAADEDEGAEDGEAVPARVKLPGGGGCRGRAIATYLALLLTRSRWHLPGCCPANACLHLQDLLQLESLQPPTPAMLLCLCLSAPGAVHKSPSWKSLSASASVPDSIKGLARRYTSDLDTMSLLSSPELSPLATTPLLLSANRQGDGVSPSPPAPTPHHLLEGWLQRNNLYESPTLPAGAPTAPGQPVAEEAPVPSGAVLPAPGEQAGQQQVSKGNWGASCSSWLYNLSAAMLAFPRPPLGQLLDGNALFGNMQAGPGTRAAVGSRSEPLLAGEISPFSGAVHLAAAVPMHALHSGGLLHSVRPLAQLHKCCFLQT